MTERTPTDYALEFAEYMAKGAEQLIEAVNALAMAEQARDEGDGDELDAKVDEARQDCTEFLTGLRNDIHQFRTRRDRAARAAPSLTVGGGCEIADAARVIAWARSDPRVPAVSAFTAGPDRQAAYWIEWAQSQPAAQRVEDERASFGAWITGVRGLPQIALDRYEAGHYCDMTVEFYWRAWQARAALAQAPAAEPLTDQQMRAEGGEQFVQVPTTASEAMLRPFYECPPEELQLAWQAALHIAAVERRKGRILPAHFNTQPANKA